MKPGHDAMGLIKFMSRGEWRDRFGAVLDEHIGPALGEFDLGFEDLDELIGEQWPMTLWGCAFEDFLTRTWESDPANMVDDYLRRRGWNESKLNKAYIQGLRDSAMSLYEVSEIVPGVSLMARDLLRGGEPVLVKEKSASRSLRPWDHIAARLVTGGRDVVLAGGLLAFSRDASSMFVDEVKQSLAGEGEELPLSTERVRVIAPLFSNAWLFDVLPRTLNDAAPDMTNSDGEELLFHEVRFPLATGVSQKNIASRLDTLDALERADRQFWNWLERSDSKIPTDGKMAFITTMEDGSTVLGNIILKGRALILSVNSAERAKRGSAMLTDILGDLVHAPLASIQTVEQMTAETDGRDRPGIDLPPDVAREAVHAMLDSHYRGILGQPVPMLDGLTPRQAVRTAEGRAKLVDWLKLLENGRGRAASMDDPMFTYDFSWMWDQLGVTDLRR